MATPNAADVAASVIGKLNDRLGALTPPAAVGGQAVLSWLAVSQGLVPYLTSDGSVPADDTFRSVSADTILLTTDRIVTCTASGKTLTLPTAASVGGRRYTLDNASSGDMTVATTGGQTINGQATQTVPTDSCLVVFSNGANWRIC